MLDYLATSGTNWTNTKSTSFTGSRNAHGLYAPTHLLFGRETTQEFASLELEPRFQALHRNRSTDVVRICVEMFVVVKGVIARGGCLLGTRIQGNILDLR